MTTEQQIEIKAKELVEKFYDELNDEECYVRDGDCSIEFELTRYVAKQCAIICIDEIIASKPIHPNPEHLESLSGKVESSIKFYEAIKEKIKQL